MNMDIPPLYNPKDEEFMNQFDVVIICEVLQHLIFDVNLLYLAWSYLKDDGHLFITTENKRLVKHSVRYYPDKIILKMLEVLQYKTKEHTTQGQTNYIWVHAQKVPNAD